jgi:hypothetical protein
MEQEGEQKEEKEEEEKIPPAVFPCSSSKGEFPHPP